MFYNMIITKKMKQFYNALAALSITGYILGYSFFVVFTSNDKEFAGVLLMLLGIWGMYYLTYPKFLFLLSLCVLAVAPYFSGQEVEIAITSTLAIITAICLVIGGFRIMRKLLHDQVKMLPRWEKALVTREFYEQRLKELSDHSHGRLFQKMAKELLPEAPKFSLANQRECSQFVNKLLFLNYKAVLEWLALSPLGTMKTVEDEFVAEMKSQSMDIDWFAEDVLKVFNEKLREISLNVLKKLGMTSLGRGLEQKSLLLELAVERLTDTEIARILNAEAGFSLENFFEMPTPVK